MEIREFLKEKGGVHYDPHANQIQSGDSFSDGIGIAIPIASEFGNKEVGNFIAEAINEKLTGGWVSVYSKLPEKGERVLVFTAYGSYDVAFLNIRDVFLDAGGLEIEFVTHWKKIELPK